MTGTTDSGGPELPAEALDLLEEEGEEVVFGDRMVFDLGVEVDGIPQGVRLSGWDYGDGDTDLAWVQVPLHFDAQSSVLFTVSLWQTGSMTGASDVAQACTYADTVVTTISVEEVAEGVLVSSTDEPVTDLVVRTVSEFASLALDQTLCPVCSPDGEGWAISISPPHGLSEADLSRCLDAFWSRCTGHLEVVPGDDDGNPAVVAGQPWERRGGVWAPV